MQKSTRLPVLLNAGSVCFSADMDRRTSAAESWKLALVALVIALALAHLRWAKVHALQGAILLASLAIVWLGVQLATGGA